MKRQLGVVRPPVQADGDLGRAFHVRQRVAHGGFHHRAPRAINRTALGMDFLGYRLLAVLRRGPHRPDPRCIRREQAVAFSLAKPLLISLFGLLVIIRLLCLPPNHPTLRQQFKFISQSRGPRITKDSAHRGRRNKAGKPISISKLTTTRCFTHPAIVTDLREG
jgi:hypothetical protein